MMNGRVLISEEPLEVTPISWDTRAIFRTVATPRKILERILSMPQSDSYSANLILADGSLNPISEAALRSLKFPRGTVGVEFSHSYVISGGWVTIWIAIKFREKTLTLQGDACGVSSAVTWLLTTEETRE
jgi:hypothetical protein